MGSFSIWHWMIVLAIVVMVFGTKRLRSAGTDLGAAVKNFKSAVREGELAGQEIRRQGQDIASALPAPATHEADRIR